LTTTAIVRIKSIAIRPTLQIIKIAESPGTAAAASA
jgi:hypothetical protein